MHGRYATSFNPRYADAYLNLSEALDWARTLPEGHESVEEH